MSHSHGVFTTIEDRDLTRATAERRALMPVAADRQIPNSRWRRLPSARLLAALLHRRVG